MFILWSWCKFTLWQLYSHQCVITNNVIFIMHFCYLKNLFYQLSLYLKWLYFQVTSSGPNFFAPPPRISFVMSNIKSPFCHCCIFVEYFLAYIEIHWQFLFPFLIFCLLNCLALNYTYKNMFIYSKWITLV